MCDYQEINNNGTEIITNSMLFIDKLNDKQGIILDENESLKRLRHTEIVSKCVHMNDENCIHKIITTDKEQKSPTQEINKNKTGEENEGKYECTKQPHNNCDSWIEIIEENANTNGKFNEYEEHIKDNRSLDMSHSKCIRNISENITAQKVIGTEKKDMCSYGDEIILDEREQTYIEVGSYHSDELNYMELNLCDSFSTDHDYFAMDPRDILETEKCSGDKDGMSPFTSNKNMQSASKCEEINEERYGNVEAELQFTEKSDESELTYIEVGSYHSDELDFSYTEVNLCDSQEADQNYTEIDSSNTLKNEICSENESERISHISMENVLQCKKTNKGRCKNDKVQLTEMHAVLNTLCQKGKEIIPPDTQERKDIFIVEDREEKYRNGHMLDEVQNERTEIFLRGTIVHEEYSISKKDEHETKPFSIDVHSNSNGMLDNMKINGEPIINEKLAIQRSNDILDTKYSNSIQVSVKNQTEKGHNVNEKPKHDNRSHLSVQEIANNDFEIIQEKEQMVTYESREHKNSDANVSTIQRSNDKLDENTNHVNVHLQKKQIIDEECEIAETKNNTQNFPKSTAETNKCNVKLEHVEIKPESKDKQSQMLITAVEKEFTSNVDKEKEITIKTDTNFKENKPDIQKNLPSNIDYYEDEKSDIEHPEWQNIKNLNTNEERYQQVRECWRSIAVPNPNKNLTYHSFRKRHLESRKVIKRPIKQHKRHASNQLQEREAKRSCSCTYLIDYKINSVSTEKDESTRKLENKINNQINALDAKFCQLENQLRNCYGYSFHFQNYYYILQSEYEQEIRKINYNYQVQSDKNEALYESKIASLKKVRDEIFQFYNFYKGLDATAKDDPTIVRESQLQELNEIENVYFQYETYYKK